MTTAQETALAYGLLGFVVVWGVVLIPQFIGHYARFGRIQGKRIATTAAVTLYTCLAVAVVLLPLPGPDSPRLAQTVQLMPLRWVVDVENEMAWSGLSAPQAVFTLAFQQLAMNVLLFVPLGMFARLLWRRGAASTTLLGFSASLFIEITQVTANFGTAPYVYRIFDVDDLMANTVGTMVGWIAVALFLPLLAACQGRTSTAATATTRTTSLTGSATSPAVPSWTTRPLPAGPAVRAADGRGGVLPVDPRTQPWPLRR